MRFSEQKWSDKACSLNQDLGVFIFLDAFFNFFSFFLKKQNYFLNYSQIISKILSIHIIHAHFILLACTVCWIFQKGEVNFTTYIDSTKFVRYYLKRHRNFWETNHNIGCLCSFILTFIWDKIFTWRVKHISSFFMSNGSWNYNFFVYVHIFCI